MQHAFPPGLASELEATVRLIARPEGARPVLFGFETSEQAGACVTDVIGSGIIPVAIEFMDKPAIEICEAFAKAGYPLDVRSEEQTSEIQSLMRSSDAVIC